MPHPPTKIATCCYCGARAALTLSGRDRHELACAGCGAPLHELKMLRTDAAGERELVRPSAVRKAQAPARGHRAPAGKRPRKRKTGAGKAMAGFWDAAEDLLDDLFDVFD